MNELQEKLVSAPKACQALGVECDKSREENLKLLGENITVRAAPKCVCVRVCARWRGWGVVRRRRVFKEKITSG